MTLLPSWVMDLHSKVDPKAALRLKGMLMGYGSAPEGGPKATLRLKGMLMLMGY